ncbi:unnamed protein product [Adineta steineri]|uniref:Uncharacterized protein n=1 Tax=Adineta steineri TaxID=433720 RepID=A0A819IZ84_9BILA|nr:unnamed protein product [Adineta steineri]CAF3923960.1 unnamed protein product [Adineta steineri]
MSTTNHEDNTLIACDFCKRRYNIKVYERHISENQCIKRNNHRLPFESVKQRSVHVGDEIIPIQQQSKQKNNNFQIFNKQENKKQISPNHSRQNQEKPQKALPSNNRQRSLERARQLFQRRIKYKPPLIQKRSNLTKNFQTQHSSNNTINTQLLTKKPIQRLYSHEQSPSPTTKFNDIPIEKSDNRIVSKQPILTDKQPNFANSFRTQHSSNNVINTQVVTKKSIQQLHAHERSPPPTIKFANDDVPIEKSDYSVYNRTVSKQPILTRKRSNFTNNSQAEHSFNNAINTQLLTKKPIQQLHTHERSSPPTTKFKNDDVPIKVSDDSIYNCTVSKQPVLTPSPKTPIAHASITSKYQSNRADQTFSQEQASSSPRTMRNATTWTRLTKQSSPRNTISPIQIPTFHESSSASRYDRISIPLNQNYDDDDEFERYSPTPPSTPKYQHHDKTYIKQNLSIDEQVQNMIRPITYQTAKRSERQLQNEIPINSPTKFHLPPINPSSYSKIRHHSTRNPSPWR